MAATREDPLVGEMTAGKLRHYTSVTQENGPRMGRITSLMESGQLFADRAMPPLDPASDGAMICGSMAMINDTKALLEKAGLKEGSNAQPAEFVIERAFVGWGRGSNPAPMSASPWPASSRIQSMKALRPGESERPRRHTSQ